MNFKIKIILCTFVALSYNCVAQIVNIEADNGTRTNGTYYKDSNNLLNPFEGTYLFTNGNTSIKLVLKKKLASSMNGIYTEDLLVGEYKYIKNGVEQKNTLSKLNFNYSNGEKYTISGNNIIDSNSYQCYDCYPGEIRLLCSLKEETVGSTATIIIRRIIQLGQPAIKIELWWMKKTQNQSDAPLPPNPSIPAGEYILIKQPS